MVVTALVVSIVALCVSGASAFYARQQAVAQREVTEIESRREHKERAPDLRADVEDVNGDQLNLLLRVLNQSDEAIDRFEVTLPPGSPLAFARGQSGVLPDSSGSEATSYDGPIGPGERAVWRVEMDEDSGADEAAVMVRSIRNDQHWDRRIEVDLPYDILDTVL